MSIQPARRPKFQVQKATKDFTSKIAEVIKHVSCGNHDAIEGEPCYMIGERRAVCGSRSNALYTGTVSDKSRSNKRPTKEHS